MGLDESDHSGEGGELTGESPTPGDSPRKETQRGRPVAWGTLEVVGNCRRQVSQVVRSESGQLH